MDHDAESSSAEPLTPSPSASFDPLLHGKFTGNEPLPPGLARCGGQEDEESLTREVEPPFASELLDEFELHGWRPDPTLTDDENYMDVVLLITRSASVAPIVSLESCRSDRIGKTGTLLRQGHMGALIVSPSSPSTSKSTNDDPVPTHEQRIASLESRLYGGILGAATNAPLFRRNSCSSITSTSCPTSTGSAANKKETFSADVHAEITALAQASLSLRLTAKCTVYVTKPPCKNCFASLVAFQIGRIVSRRLPPPLIAETARERGIEVAQLGREENRRQMARINGLVNRSENGSRWELKRSDEDLMRIVERNRRWREKRRKARQARAGTTID